MKRFLTKLLILAGMLMGLPFFGIILAGFPIGRYLEFPPETRYVHHAPFSWIAFIAYALFILSVVLPFLIMGRKKSCRVKTEKPAVRPFPWWGWLGMFTGGVAWVLVWTRFDWFVTFQPHTFTPLWVSLILVANALSYRRTDHCLMVDRTGFFLLLFPFSAIFWWLFEYLNRFVQNWFYVGARFDSWEYFWYATLPFSTVLPAVLSVREWISAMRWIQTRFQHMFPLKSAHPKRLAGATLGIAGIGLAAIGVWPNYLFSLLWVSPLLIVISLQILMGEQQIFSDISFGNWGPVISAALAALICGIFWETWNYFSFAKWKYTVPFVHRFQIFEMPILGYAGYLPFGLECAVIGNMLENLTIFPRTDSKPS